MRKRFWRITWIRGVFGVLFWEGSGFKRKNEMDWRIDLDPNQHFYGKEPMHCHQLSRDRFLNELWLK
jgi:hypothetical protein